MFTYSTFTHDYDQPIFRHAEPLSEDFNVCVNGVSVPVYTCRISAYPLNRVWTGYQRPGNQTEVASFVNLVADEPLTLTVTAHRAHERVLLKPYSAGIAPVEADGIITFTIPGPGQFVLETDSYHHCLYIFVSLPIPEPDPASVTHFFGPGVHFPGKITLRSHESVYVHRDALVFGCIFAENAEDIHIFGNGLLDDMGEGRCSIHCYEPFTNGNLKFYDCRHLRIEGVLLRDSAIWCLNLFHCEDVVVDGIKIFGQWRYNTDGIDIVNSRDVTIRRSFIHSFDDTIVIKGIERYAEFDNVNILTEDCVLWCDWGKTCELGIETCCRRYENITFRSCDILRAGNTALCVDNGETAEMSGILFEDIRVEYNAFDTPEQYQSTDDTVYTRQSEHAIPTLLWVKNPRWRTAQTEALWGISQTCRRPLDLTGIRPASVHGVVCRNIQVYYDEGLPMTADGRYDVRIFAESYLDDVRFSDIRVSNIRVNGVKLSADTAVVRVQNVDGFVFE